MLRLTGELPTPLDYGVCPNHTKVLKMSHRVFRTIESSAKIFLMVGCGSARVLGLHFGITAVLGRTSLSGSYCPCKVHTKLKGANCPRSL